jgi:hypothetical protein
MSDQRSSRALPKIIFALPLLAGAAYNWGAHVNENSYPIHRSARRWVVDERRLRQLAQLARKGQCDRDREREVCLIESCM